MVRLLVAGVKAQHVVVGLLNERLGVVTGSFVVAMKHCRTLHFHIIV